MEPKYFESLYPEAVYDKELDRIVSYIKEGNSSQLVGLPGVGRSSVLSVLAYNKKVRLRHFPRHHGIVHFVMINFSEVRKRPYTDVLKFIFLSLGNSLRERVMMEEYEKVDGLFKDALSYNDELVFSQHLKIAVEYLAIDKKLTVVFLLDKFDEYIPQVSDDFFTLLRSLRDRAKYRFSAIFSLSRPLDDSLEPQLMSDFSDSILGHTVYMPLYDEVCIDFRISYLEKIVGRELVAKEKEEIILLTGGHMRLLMVCVEAVLANDVVPENLVEFLLGQRTLQAALISLWKSLTPSEQSAIVDNSFDAEQDSYLERIGLIKNDRLSLPLFHEGLKRGIFKENEAKFIYEETTNIIKKGEVIVSDRLTKGEFRLLRYLLQHQEEIVDREMIVSTVWQEDKSSAGITDQAIDQLLFRLRRKIEEDPNNPLHLHTIKGRGVKFTQ